MATPSTMAWSPARQLCSPIRALKHRQRHRHGVIQTSRVSACASPPRHEQDAEFQSLLEQCGATHDPLVLATGQYGRGLFLPSGAVCARVVLSVPLHYALVVRGDLDAADPDAIEASRVRGLHTAWQAAAGVTLPDSLKLVLDSTFPAEQRLALFLLFATRSGSPLWTRLGQLLPDAATCPSPLLWTDAQLAELHDTALAVQCSAARQTASRGFEGFLESWPLGKELHAALGSPSPSDFVWALSMVQSRGMADQLGVSGGAQQQVERVAMLVPFADMANHLAYDPGFSGAVNDAGTAFEFTCCKAQGVPAGGELTVSYRDKASNTELMRKYGFSTRSNRTDWFLLGALDPMGRRACSVDPARLGAVAAAAIKDEHVRTAVLASLPMQSPEDGAASSVADQAQRAQALREALTVELAAFRSTLADDEALLRDISSMPPMNDADAGCVVRLEAAVLYRMERKRIITAALSAVGVYAAAVSKVAARR